MKYTHVAICSNSDSLWDNSNFNLNYTKNIPGASWVPFFKKKCEEKGIKVVSGYSILKAKIDYEKVLIIQELNSWHAISLINKGAKPFLILSGESKLYAY